MTTEVHIIDIQLALVNTNCCAQQKNLWRYDSNCKRETN